VPKLFFEQYIIAARRLGNLQIYIISINTHDKPKSLAAQGIGKKYSAAPSTAAKR
jgi:hypothetical protein